MSYRNRTLSEKKRIYKKLGLVIAAILVVCIALAIALRPTKGNVSHNASGTQAVEGMIEKHIFLWESTTWARFRKSPIMRGQADAMLSC